MFNNVIKPQKPVTFGGSTGETFYFWGDIEYGREQSGYGVGERIVIDNSYLFVAQTEGMIGATEPDWDTSAIGAQTVDGDVTWEYRPLYEVYDPVTISVPAGVDGATAVYIQISEHYGPNLYNSQITITLNDNTEIIAGIGDTMYPDPDQEHGLGCLAYFAQGDSPDKLIKSVTIQWKPSLQTISDLDFLAGRVYFSTRGGTPANGGFTNNHYY